MLIDNIESDSTPVIYTRRSRFLDEELDENKDIITTNSTVNGCGSAAADQRTYHKISMLMSDGASLPNESKTEQYKANHHVTDNVNSIDIAHAYCDERGAGQRDECDQQNQKYCTNATHITMSDSIGLDRGFNGLSMNEHDLNQIDTFGQPIKDSNATQDGNHLKDHIDSNSTDQQQQQSNQFLHMHQFRQQHQMSLVDETSFLRRQQLSRVAEWVQNNNHEACLQSPDGTDYKQATKLNNNSDEISNRSVDRNLKSLSMANCNTLSMNDLAIGKRTHLNFPFFNKYMLSNDYHCHYRSACY